MIDGAGSFRILRSVIIPQAQAGDRGGQPVPLLLCLERVLPAARLPAVRARASAAGRRAEPGSTRCTRQEPTLIQAAAIMAMALPVVVFFLAQRAFMRGVVFTRRREVATRALRTTSTTTTASTSSHAPTRRCRGSTTRHRGLLRAHLEHGGRLLVLPRRPAAAADPLPLQQRPARRRRPLPLHARRRDGEFWNPSWQPTQDATSTTTSAATASATRRSPGSGGHPRRDAVLRAARRDARDLADAGHQRAPRTRRALSLFWSSSSACGTPTTTRPTTSATSRPARSRSRTA